MRLKTKATALTLTFVAALLLLLALVSAWAFHQFALSTAREHARTAAEMVRVSMTESMLNGVISKRQRFLDRIAQVDGLQQARLIRSPAVSRQFGSSDNSLPDSIEARVMATATPYYKLEEGAALFRATIPYTASNEGDTNCLHCHQVANGTVLGIVTIKISIETLQVLGIEMLWWMIGSLAACAIIFVIFFRRQLSPVIDTAQGVQEVVQRARVGEFSGRINYQGNDEVAQIATELNRLMGYLEERLGETCKDVAKLMKYELPRDINLLQTTTEMVAGLVDVSQFKQEIEDDQTKMEVYSRISRILRDQFKIGHFSLYETTAHENSMQPMVVDGDTNADCRWCDRTILSQADSCRAMRTGNIIDSVAQPDICNRFCNNGDQRFKHICIPVIHSGSVGSVVQLVFNGDFSREVYTVLPLILVYLRESSAVIEAKRLMDTLRETTLRDAMTGLRNRRFLEEYMNTLVASAKRKEQHLSVLMMDLDHFKQVNDSYGHEAGDIVLKTLAQTLQAQVRDSDLVIRYGGEEFMVILQEAADKAYCGESIAEKIRQAVEARHIQIPGAQLRKTLSIGVAYFPQDHNDFWQVVKFADSALYHAKHNGRNQVVHWRAELEAGSDSATSENPA